MSGPSIAGRSEVRLDIVEKVTGRARYTGDITLPGMVHAVLVRSEIGHGFLRGVDVSAARVMPGVLAVATSRDFTDIADPCFGEWVRDQPFLAIDRVRFIGEPVAAVVAASEAEALEAAAAVVVDVDPLPVLGSAAEALADRRTAIHPERESADPDRPNVCYRSEFEYGDVDGALASAEWVHEATYHFPAAYHYAMEPHSCIATWASEGLEVISGTQQPFKVRGDLARIFSLPLNRVRVRAPFVGGGFGSKGQAKYEPVTAALARLTGRPVRLVVSVGEAMHTVSRHEATITMRTGIDASGAITARDTFIVYDTGAYADKGPRVSRKGAYRATGPYQIPNLRSVALSVYSNRVPAGAFRGFSTPQVVWAGESAIDEIAEHRGEDPVAYRTAHLKRRGEPFLGNDAPLDADLAAGLAAAADAVGWGGPHPPKGRGRGVAVGVKDGGGGASKTEAEVRLHPDGSVEVRAATVELGQGATTVLAQIAAEALGAEMDSVRVRLSDTEAAPFDRGTNASRSTISVGSAIEAAARRVREELLEAIDAVGLGGDEVALRGSDVVIGGRSHPLLQVLAQARALPVDEVGAIVAVGSHGTASGGGPLGHTSAFYEVGHTAVEVDVDCDTGVVKVTRLVSVADVGFAINPATCEGQDEGAAVMGLGHTLFEELEFDDGELINGNLVEYRVPRAEDVPEQFRTILLENRDGPGPHGAKGAGEGGLLAVAPAVANAVFAAVGVRLRELPLTPERVWRSLRDQER